MKIVFKKIVEYEVFGKINFEIELLLFEREKYLL